MVITSVLTLLGVGFLLAIILAAASKVLSVEEDPRVEALLDLLPGANCGGCGYAGCEAYAIAVLNVPDVAANLCTVGGADTAAKVGKLAGKDVLAGEPMVSFRRCSRNEGNVKPRYEYIGSRTCSSAALLEGGPFMCSWACLGFGDCLRACPFDAMYIKDGMVEIITSRCVSCGICIKACPRALLQLIPQRARVVNCCATKDSMKAVTEVCDVGCINCMKCIKACPVKAVSHTNGRIEIDHATCLECHDCGEACVSSCPRKILRSRSMESPTCDSCAPVHEQVDLEKNEAHA